MHRYLFLRSKIRMSHTSHSQQANISEGFSKTVSEGIEGIRYMNWEYDAKAITCL